jgi:hypothetical protein
MAKPWEKFNKTSDSAVEAEGEDGLSFDMGASISEEVEDDSDDLDFNIDTTEDEVSEPAEAVTDEVGFSIDDSEVDDETAATMIFNKDSSSLEELANASVDNEEDLEKTINKIVGLDSDDEMDLNISDDASGIKSKLPEQPKLDSISNNDVFSTEDNDGDDEDAATRILSNVSKKLKEDSDVDFGMRSDPMFGDDEDNEDAATRVLQVNKQILDNEAADNSLSFGGLENSDFVVEKEQEVDNSIASREPRMSTLSSDELIRFQATIRQLRTERADLLNDISSVKQDGKMLESDNLGLKAELDEMKIELTILKKRKSSENDDIIYQNELANEKKEILEEKNKHLQKEFDRLNQKVRVDFNQIKQREKELESQLELVSMDSESQVRSRDVKILELKRHIDQLEFNMENASIKEQKSREDKVKLEDKLSKVIKSLRSSMNLIEDGIDCDLDSSLKHKKI